MALKQAITQEDGYDATYWRITRVDINWTRTEANLIMVGYKDQAKRQSDPDSGVKDTRRYTIDGDVFGTYFDAPDLSSIQSWVQSNSYSTGELVQTSTGVYKASTNISSGATAPDQNADWTLDTDLRLNREKAYDHIKQEGPDFSGATDV